MSFAIAGTVISAGSAIYGANKASKAKQKGDTAAIAEQRRQFDLIMQMLQPQINTGTQALNTLNRLYGYNTSPIPNVTGANAGAGATPSNFNPQTPLSRAVAQILGRVPGGTAGTATPGATASGATAPGAPQPTGLDVFFASPDYEFRRGEGMRGIENSFAARGGAASGNALRALNEFNSNLASSEFGNFFNRQAALAGIGQAATSQGVGAASSTGKNVSSLLQDRGDSRASGIADMTNALTGGIGDLLSYYGYRNGGGGGGGGNGGYWDVGANQQSYPWDERYPQYQGGYPV